MKIHGLVSAMTELFINAKRVPAKWGMTAVEKDELKKPGKADAAKKRARKVVEASRRGNRS